jgi:hypothetical protein
LHTSRHTRKNSGFSTQDEHRVLLGSEALTDAPNLRYATRSIYDEVTRFIGAAKGDAQRTALFIHDPTRHVLLLAAHIVITGSVVATGATTTGKLADFHRRFTVHPQAFDMAC